MKSKKSKKSILIIGLGKFGRYLALKMQELGNQVMVVDKEEAESQKLATKIDAIKLCRTRIPNPSQGDFGFSSLTMFFISVV